LEKTIIPVKKTHLLNCIIYTLLTAIPLVLSGCSGATFGEEAGGGGAAMANGAAAASGETVRTGSISSTIIQGTVTIIAEHVATQEQRKVAVERAHIYIAHEHARAVASVAAGHKAPPHHRYIAVDTEPDSRTAPQAKKSVMIFDTEAQQVVGNNVYDVQSPPPVGATARFETYSAQYVGPGQ
jgi:hypothetical protein